MARHSKPAIAPGEKERFVEFSSLAVYAAVARERSLTVAAQQIGLTQPAVSLVLKQIETSMGIELIDRTKRPVRLTSAGLRFQDYADTMLAEARRIAAVVRQTASTATPKIRLGMIDSASSVLGPHIVNHLKDHAEKLTIRGGINRTIRDEFLGRELDIVVTTDSFDAEGGLERHELFRDPLLIVAPAEFRDRSLNGLREIARQLPLVRYNRDSTLGVQIDVFLRRLGLEPANRYEIDTTDSLFRMVSAGPGWAITTAICLLQAQHSLGIATPSLLPGSTVSRCINLIAREGEHGKIPKQVSRVCRSVLNATLLPQLQNLLPALRKEQFRI
jgi:DNA-binding transcriptional LysR family regulator